MPATLGSKEEKGKLKALFSKMFMRQDFKEPDLTRAQQASANMHLKWVQEDAAKTEKLLEAQRRRSRKGGKEVAKAYEQKIGVSAAEVSSRAMKLAMQGGNALPMRRPSAERLSR